MNKDTHSQLFELTRIRTVAFLRQPEAVFWVFAFPLVLAAVLGWAFQSGSQPPSQIAVLSRATDPAVIQRLEAQADLVLEAFEDEAEARRALLAGKVDVIVGSGAEPDLELDPVRKEATLAELRLRLALSDAPPALSVTTVREPGSRYVDFLFPGLLGMNLMGTGLWSISFAVAELRQRKIMKRLLVTPMRRSSFLGSFLLARLAFLTAEVVLLTAFGFWALSVPLRGSWLAFAALCLLGAVAFAAMGLLAAARVKTIEGASGMLNLVMMPMWLGSGVFFSYERFPEAVQPVLRALPLTMLNDGLRAIMLEGANFAAIAPQILGLTIWTALPFALALRLFRWS